MCEVIVKQLRKYELWVRIFEDLRDVFDICPWWSFSLKDYLILIITEKLNRLRSTKY